VHLSHAVTAAQGARFKGKTGCTAQTKKTVTFHGYQVRAAVRSLDRGGEPQDELHVLRVRSRKHEILIAPDYDRGQEYALVVVQDPSVE